MGFVEVDFSWLVTLPVANPLLFLSKVPFLLDWAYFHGSLNMNDTACMMVALILQLAHKVKTTTESYLHTITLTHTLYSIK